MKKLPNGDIAFYNDYGIWSLIGGVVLAIIIIVMYFAIPFTEGDSWMYIFMATPFVVMDIMLFKSYFKPSPRFIISQKGVKFIRHNKIFNSSIKLYWDQIENVYYDKMWAGGRRTHYIADMLLFKTKDNIIYQFNLSSFTDSGDKYRLRNILEEHNLKITTPPIEKKNLEISKPWPMGKSNCEERFDGVYLFFKKGRIWSLFGAIVLSIGIILGYFSKSIDSVGWFFMTLPAWVFVIMLGKSFFKPLPAIIIAPDSVFFTPINHPSVAIKWIGIREIRKELRNLGQIDGVQPTLVFTLKDGITHVASLKDIVKVDYDKIVSLCAEHNIVVQEK